MPARVEVELDIFSGMPNPAYALTDAEAETFLHRLATAPPASPTELSGNLGYRGFIVQLIQGADSKVIHIQNGAIQVSKGTEKTYARDGNRDLERWLFDTAKPHLKNEVLQAVQREIR
jgi:hypothetical protein